MMGPRGALMDCKGGTGWEVAREKGSFQNVQTFQRQVPCQRKIFPKHLPL